MCVVVVGGTRLTHPCLTPHSFPTHLPLSHFPPHLLLSIPTPSPSSHSPALLTYPPLSLPSNPSPLSTDFSLPLTTLILVRSFSLLHCFHHYSGHLSLSSVYPPIHSTHSTLSHVLPPNHSPSSSFPFIHSFTHSILLFSSMHSLCSPHSSTLLLLTLHSSTLMSLLFHPLTQCSTFPLTQLTTSLYLSFYIPFPHFPPPHYSIHIFFSSTLSPLTYLVFSPSPPIQVVIIFTSHSSLISSSLSIIWFTYSSPLHS